MKTLALSNGDLVVTPMGHATITGAQKINTEISLALGEPIGTDIYHQNYGSHLQDYLGLNVDAGTQLAVQAEVLRVLNAYIQVQTQDVVHASYSNLRSPYSTADIVKQVTSVIVTPSLDSIFVSISLTTMSNEDLTITKVVSV